MEKRAPIAGPHRSREKKTSPAIKTQLPGLVAYLGWTKSIAFSWGESKLAIQYNMYNNGTLEKEKPKTTPCVALLGVSMTPQNKWVHEPCMLGTDPIVKSNSSFLLSQLETQWPSGPFAAKARGLRLGLRQRRRRELLAAARPGARRARRAFRDRRGGPWRTFRSRNTALGLQVITTNRGFDPTNACQQQPNSGIYPGKKKSVASLWCPFQAMSPHSWVQLTHSKHGP